jgi:hypothetical protein
MTNSCPQCGSQLAFTATGALPPWCRSCGADIKIDADALRSQAWTCTKNENPAQQSDTSFSQTTGSQATGSTAAETQSSPTESLPCGSVEDELTAFARRQLGVKTESELDVYQTPRRRKSRLGNDSRFATHNAMVGLVLAGMGLVAGAAGGTDSEFLGSFTLINSAVNGLQMLLVATGFALVVSGMGIKNKSQWAFPLAGCCAVSYLIGGVLFGVSWLHIKNAASTVEESVEVIGFVTANMDLLLGLIDGVAIFWLVKNSRQHNNRAEQSRQSSLIYG